MSKCGPLIDVYSANFWRRRRERSHVVVAGINFRILYSEVYAMTRISGQKKTRLCLLGRLSIRGILCIANFLVHWIWLSRAFCTRKTIASLLHDYGNLMNTMLHPVHHLTKGMKVSVPEMSSTLSQNWVRQFLRVCTAPNSISAGVLSVPRRGAHGAVRDLWKSNGSG